MIKLEAYKSDMTGLLRHEVSELKTLLSILLSLPNYLTGDLDSAAFISKIKNTIQAYEYMLRHSEKFDRLRVQEMDHDDEIDAASQLQTWTDEAKSIASNPKFRVTMNPRQEFRPDNREIRPDLAVVKESALETVAAAVSAVRDSIEVKPSVTGTVTLSGGSGITLSPGTTFTLSQGTSSTGATGIDVTTGLASPIDTSTNVPPIVNGANEWIWKELIADYIPESMQYKASGYPNFYSKAVAMSTKATLVEPLVSIQTGDGSNCTFSVNLSRWARYLSIYDFVEIYMAYRRDIYGNSDKPFTEDDPVTLSGKLLGNASGWIIALGAKLGNSVNWKDMTLIELLAAYQEKKNKTDREIVDMLGDKLVTADSKSTVTSIPVPPGHKPGEPISYVPPATEEKTMEAVLEGIKWPITFTGVPHGTSDRMNLLSWHHETWVMLIKDFIGERLGVVTFNNTYKTAFQLGVAHVMGDVFNINDPSYKLGRKDYIDLFEAYMTDLHLIGRARAPMQNPMFAENKILYYSDAIMTFICNKIGIPDDKRKEYQLVDLLRRYRDKRNTEEKR